MNRKRALQIIGGVTVAGAALFAVLSGTVYYVSTAGSDSNPCTQSAPCKTITRGISIAAGGDSVSVEVGTYREYVYISKPITLVSNGAIIDGTNATGTVREGLLEVRANGVTVEGFTIANAKVYGLANFGNNNKFLNNIIHHTQGAGVWNRDAKSNLFEGNELYFTVLQNSTSFDGQRYVCSASNSNWPSAINSWGAASGNTWRSNNVHDNCGEGMVVYSGDVVENNTFKDNWSIEVYIVANNATVRNNIILDTRPYLARGANQAWRSVPAGIAIGDEAVCLTDNNIISGNSITGSRYGVSFYQYVSCSGVKNTTIENNTIVNAWEYGLRILSGSHVNSTIRNNVIELTDGKPLTLQSSAFVVTGNQFFSKADVFEYVGKTYNFAGWNGVVPGNTWKGVTVTVVPSNTPAVTKTATPTRTLIPPTVTLVPATGTPGIDAKCDPKYLPNKICVYIMP